MPDLKPTLGLFNFPLDISITMSDRQLDLNMPQTELLIFYYSLFIACTFGLKANHLCGCSDMTMVIPITPLIGS